MNSPSQSIRAHKEVLYFASPFFEAALSGDWAETGGRPQSMSSVITISQPRTIPGSSSSPDGNPELSLAFLEQEIEFVETLEDDKEGEDETSDGDGEWKDAARQRSLEKLQNASNPPSSALLDKGKHKALEVDVGRPYNRVRKRSKQGPDAVIVLKEEKVFPIND